MARDVEFNLTASDKTGPALNAAAEGFKRTQDRIAKDTKRVTEDLYGNGLVRTAAKAAPRLTGALVGAAAQAASQAGPILGSMGALAAPVIAGTLSAAIIGGAGIGGVIGGVMLVKDDPRVAAAGKALGAKLTSDLKDYARPFVEPVLQGITTIEDRFGEVEGNLRSIFANSSKFVAPLVDGGTRFAQGVIRGLDALTSKGAPVIEAISGFLDQAGTDVEDFLTEIASGSENAAASVRQLSDLFGATLATLGPLVNGINQVAATLDQLGISPGLLQAIDQLRQATDATGTFSAQQVAAGPAIAGTTAAAQQQVVQLSDLNAQLRGATDASLGLYDAQTQTAQALADSKKAIAENGEGLSLNSERGRENRTVLARLAGTLNSNYDAYVKVNGAGQGADAVMRSNRENFIRVATAASGSAAKARQLANELLGIPPERKPKITLLDNASGKIDNVINRLSAVRSKTVTLNIAVRQSGDAAALRKQSLPAYNANAHFAATTGDGGMYRTGGPAKVDVNQTLNVNLDGQPFYSYTDQRIAESDRRQAWRRKVGTV